MAHLQAGHFRWPWSLGRERASEAAWALRPVAERVGIVCALRHMLADRAAEFVEALRMPHRTTEAESLAGEIIPLADACGFLEREAARLLRVRRLNGLGRPLWLWGVGAEIRREPMGEVLIIGPGNYPLMLAGIPIVQALVAGNRVIFKPAPGTRGIAALLCDALHELGVPLEALVLLGEDPEAAAPWFARVDKVFMTGSERSGAAVMQALAGHMVPAVMELSGCDAAFVLPGADLARVAAALRFGLTFNNSATCMAPRRAFVHESVADGLIAELKRSLADVVSQPIPPAAAARLNELGGEALAAGASVARGAIPFAACDGPLVFDHAKPGMRLLQEDIMAPFLSVVRVRLMDEALRGYEQCRYRLGASIFGPVEVAREMAREIQAGSVVINDVIVPTADPRLPLGGQKRSGFGVTRGGEGLLEMTRVKTISVRRGAQPAHLRPDAGKSGRLLRAYLGATHGRTLRQRMGAWLKVLGEGKRLSEASSRAEK